MQGTIKKLTNKHFGFITPEGDGKDLFFHANELVDANFDDLREGDNVTFEIADTPKGEAATKVTLA
ncbi:cold shock domain-containing protein [Candidatus Nomurabacteria bacterium]|nr:cold shock domain-containing protein [Candidatus Nomurabacteria bacterium]